MRGYTLIGGIGALVGVNIISFILNLEQILGPIARNHIAESVALLAVLGIIYDILPSKWRKNTYLIIPVAIITGYIWEPLSFLAIGNLELLKSVILPWTIYGIPTIILVGFPVLIISKFIQKEHKLFGNKVRSVGARGLIINFITCMLFTMFVFYIMVSYEVYIWFGSIIGLL